MTSKETDWAEGDLAIIRIILTALLAGLSTAIPFERAVTREHRSKEDPMSKLSVIYYSATGHGTAMANRVAAAAEAAGAEARVCHIAETRDPQSFAQNPAWIR
jgi:sulfite reductase alpha subunit-like flavoprotein